MSGTERRGRGRCAVVVLIACAACTTGTPAPPPPPTVVTTAPPASTPTIPPPTAAAPTPVPIDRMMSDAKGRFNVGDFAGAILAYKRLTDLAPGHVPAYVGLSRAQSYGLDKPDAALASAKKAVDLAPDDAGALAQLASAQLATIEDASRREQALATAQQAVASDPKSAFAQAALASALLSDLRPREALSASLAAIALDPTLGLAWQQLGDAAWTMRDFGRALAAYSKAAEVEPAFAPWQVQLGTYWRRQERFDKADAHYAKALAQAPAYAPALVGQIDVRIDKREYDQAEKLIAQLRQMAPESYRADLQQALVYTHKEDWDKARDALRAAQASGMNRRYADHLAAYISVAQSECEQGARLYENLVGSDPKDVQAQEGMGWAKLCGNDGSRALTYFRKALEQYPYSPDAHMGSALAYLSQNRVEDAAASLDLALRYNPSKGSVHPYLARVAATDEDGRRELELAIARDPFSTSAMLELALRALEGGDAEEAERLARQALAMNSADKAAQTALAAALVSQDRFAEAADLARGVVDKEPENARARYVLGIALYGLGRFKEAGKELEIYAKLAEASNILTVLIRSLNSGYEVDENVALSASTASIIQVTGLQTLARSGLLSDSVGAGRVLTITIAMPQSIDPADRLQKVLGTVGAFATVMPRIRPVITNGLVIEVREAGRLAYTLRVGGTDIRRFVTGVDSAQEFVQHLGFARAVDTATALPQIERAVSSVRLITPTAQVKSKFMSASEMTTKLLEPEDGSARQVGQELARAVLTLLGVVTKSTDLKGVEQHVAEQVRGFYMPAERTFYVVRSPHQTASDELAIAHEYVHALQDQKFDLAKMQKECDSGDACRALRALIEGDATLGSLLYADQRIPVLDLLTLQGGAAKHDAGEPVSVPDYFEGMTAFPYREGMAFAARLYRAGGWNGINALYASPPDSTELILHPEKYSANHRPISITLPDIANTLGADWQLKDTDVMGELGLQLALARDVGPVTAKSAAAGWGGDRYALLQKGPDGPYMLALFTAWDDEKEAREFFESFRVAMAHRPHASEVIEDALREPSWRQWLSDGVSIAAKRDGAKVLVAYAEESEALDTLVSQSWP